MGAPRKGPGQRRAEKQRQKSAERRALERQVHKNFYRPLVETVLDSRRDPIQLLEELARLGPVFSLPFLPETRQSERVLRQIALLRSASARRDSPAAIRHAVVATILLHQIMSRGITTPFIDRLRASQFGREDAASRGGRVKSEKRKADHEMWRRNARDWKSRNPEDSWLAIAKQLAPRAGVGFKHFYRVITAKPARSDSSV